MIRYIFAVMDFNHLPPTSFAGALGVPTIGIGASPNCDGQVLVTDDMLGLFDWTPRFVRRYANLRDTISRAAETYANDVRSGEFPNSAEVYKLKVV